MTSKRPNAATPTEAAGQPITPEGIAELAWAFLTTSVDAEGNETVSATYRRVFDGCHTLAARMIGGTRGDAESVALQELMFDLERQVRQQLVAFAARTHAARWPGSAR